MRIHARLPAILAASFILTATLFGAARAAPEGGPAGIWQTQAGDAKVQVSRCGGSLCGKVVWLRAGGRHIDITVTKRDHAEITQFIAGKACPGCNLLHIEPVLLAFAPPRTEEMFRTLMLRAGQP